MTKRDKRHSDARQTKTAGCTVRRPITLAERDEIAKSKPRRCCHDCVFYVSNLLLWMRALMLGFPVAGRCVNHAGSERTEQPPARR